MKSRVFGLLTLLFVFFMACQSAVLALSVKEWLDRASRVEGGGLPYGVCFFITGISLSCVTAYTWFLFRSGFSLKKFFASVRLAFVVSGTAAVLCTVWFVIRTGLFNPTGLLGLAVAVSAAGWVALLCTRIIAMLPDRADAGPGGVR